MPLRTLVDEPDCRCYRKTGSRHLRSRPAWPEASAFGPRPKVPAPTPTSASTAPNFRTDSGYLPVLVAQRADAETLARDAEARGWGSEVERHRRLIERLDAHIAQAQSR